MPIPGIEQPALLPVGYGLRLRKFDDHYDFALAWYQDEETTRLVDGEADRYSPERLKRMYEYLDAHGELYFIEVLENNRWVPIGDVTFWQADMPIVIGDQAQRGKGIGGQVIRALINRAKLLGYEKLEVGEIYDFNTGSRKCFESAGFRATAKTEKGWHYELHL
ncbi:MAG: GNAT family N-acetyltransferase [Oscillospiraceae bacterium]|nr:GNAT family N-acetyltransferase [Oscillospiraceae bacterium]